MKFGKSEWRYDAKKASEEAKRRIAALKESSSETGQSLVFSDLVALVEIPEELAELANLKSLHLGRYTGEIGFFLGALSLRKICNLDGLRSLSYLNLSRLNLQDLTFLQGLENLEVLSLNDAKFDSLTGLADLPSLISLHLGSTSIDDLSEVGELGELRDLNLNSSKVGDLSPIGNLSKLERLNLSGSTVSNIDGLDRLNNLEALELERTDVRDILPLSKISSLSHLNLSRTKVSGIEHLMALPDLTSLAFDHTRVRDISPILGMPRFKKMQGQNLSFVGIPAASADPGIRRLSALNPKLCATEIVTYLQENHAENPKERSSPDLSLEGSLLRNSPVEILDHYGQIEAINTSYPAKLAPEEKRARVIALKKHTAALIHECEHKQVPAPIVDRLRRYLHPLENDEPLFILLDGPMSFLRGSLQDSFLVAEITHATDKGFVAAIKQLCVMHDQVAPLLSPEESDDIPELKADADEGQGRELVNETVQVLASDDAAEKFGQTMIDALEAARDYFSVANPRPSVLTHGFKAIGGILAAMVSSTAIITWGATPQGAIVLAKLRALLEKAMAFFS